MDSIFRRRAVRKYTDEKVDEEKIQKLIDVHHAGCIKLM